jgi:hypothetical protein
MATAIVVLGGVGLFLLGMSVMTNGLKALAGSALRTVLGKAAATPLSGAFWGAIAGLLFLAGRSIRPLGDARAIRHFPSPATARRANLPLAPPRSLYPIPQFEKRMGKGKRRGPVARRSRLPASPAVR